MEDTIAYLTNCGMTLDEIDRLHNKQGLSYEEIRQAAESIIRRGGALRDEETPDPTKELRPADYSDAGSRDVFCTYYGDKIRWTPGEGWHSYNSKVWERDEGAVMERVIEFSKAMLADAQQQHIEAATALAMAQAEDTDSITKDRLAKEAKAAKSYLSFAQRQRNLYPLKSVMKLSESKLQMPDSAFDADPNLLCCSNGVLDLNTMELYPHDPGYLISKAVNAEYDPDADTTENEAFLDSIFSDDTQKKPFVKRIFGYSLTGAPKEDKLFAFHGPTSRNGKTTLALSAAATFGDCAVTLPPESIAASRFADGSRPKPDLVPLRGARLVIVEEPDQELTLDSGLIKRMTGGAEIRARQLRREEIGFTMSGPIETSEKSV